MRYNEKNIHLKWNARGNRGNFSNLYGQKFQIGQKNLRIVHKPVPFFNNNFSQII